MELTVNVNGVEITLEEKDGVVFTTSLDVSETFKKKHSNVIQKIESLSDRGRLNFKLTSYLDDSNRQSKMYEMNRDGFMLLVMGFTGKKAEIAKLDFIDGFNKMEKIIIEKMLPNKQPELPTNPMEVLEIMFNGMKQQQESINVFNTRLNMLENKVADRNEKLLDDVAEIVEARPIIQDIEVKPSKGYLPINKMNAVSRVTKDILNSIIAAGKFNIRFETDRVSITEDGWKNTYTAYNVDDVFRAVDFVIKTADKVGDKTYYSDIIGRKFQPRN